VIVTVTLNPALDLTYRFSTAADQDADVQRATSSSLEASGKGVNVSRALAKVGTPTCAVLPAGGSTGRALAELLADDGVACRVVPQSGETRVNTTALRPDGVTIKLNGPGAALSGTEQDGILQETEAALRDAAEGPVWLAICGSLPPDVDSRLIVDLVNLAHRHGARCAVDASGDALAAALGAGADLLAPNRGELADVCPSARATGSIDELAEAARALSLETGAELLISLGADGALYTDGRAAVHGSGPALTPVNTAGAGDALLAGWLAGDGAPRARLARAIAWGRSACLADTTVDPAPGTGDGAPIDVVDVLVKSAPAQQER
jgi:1-phosphofructokinase